MAVRDIKLQPDSAVAPRLLPISLEGMAVSQTGRRIFVFRPGFEFLLQPAQLFARVVAGTVAISVKIDNGGTVTTAITALAPITDDIATSPVPTVALGHGNADALIIVEYTTNGTGDVSDGVLTLAFRPFPLNGEASRVSA